MRAQRRSWLHSENAFFLESLSHCNHLWVVDKQERDRDSANLGQRFQFGSIPDEVLRPCVPSRMKQANDFASIGINAGNIRAFESIAVDASKGEVIGSSPAAVLPGNDVIDLEWRSVICRRQLAILAAGLRALPNVADEICVQCA